MWEGERGGGGGRGARGGGVQKLINFTILLGEKIFSFISTITTNKSTKFSFCLQNGYKTCWDQLKFV